MKNVFSSLFTDRAISYRVHQGFRHAEVAVSAGVQRMVRSCLGASGVMFTLDTESGFPDVDQGRRAIRRRTMGRKLEKMVYADVSESGRSVKVVPVPDEDQRRFCLTDEDLFALARQAV